MAILKVYNKICDTTYVYESKSYWDKERKQARSHRKLIGKIDPVTGAIVPTHKKGSANEHAQKEQQDGIDYKTLYENALRIINEKDAAIAKLHRRLEEEKRLNRIVGNPIRRVNGISSQLRVVKAKNIGKDLESI